MAGDVRAIVPTLGAYEVGNTLSRRLPDCALRALDALLRFGLVSAPRSRRWLRQALALTRSHGVTFYDAAYHAHAIMRRGVFVTVDAHYVKRAGSAGGVAQLANWPAAIS